MRLRPVLLLVPWLLAFALIVACDGQGEGQACSTQNGNGDCQSGLVCTQLQNGDTGARCCPQNRGLSTTPVCGIQQNGNDADTSPSTADAGEAADGSSEDATMVEASDDAAATDAAATDAAATDASADAGDAASTTDAASE